VRGPDVGALFCNSPGRYYGDRLEKEQVAEDGSFKLPNIGGNPSLIFTDAGGFLETTLEAIKREPNVKLLPKGTIEGRLMVAGKPKSGVRVNVSNLNWSPRGTFHLIYTTTTDSQGEFVFTDVPEGEYKLYRQPASQMRSGRPITESHQMPVKVNAGETTRVDYGGGGRAVIGQVEPDSPELSVDWLNDDHVLAFKQTPIPPVNREDFASFEAFRKANEESFTSPERLRHNRAARIFQLVFEPDGSFRADDVPVGTYELRIRVTKPDRNERLSPFARSEELGSFVRDVVVPEGKEPLDLGTLVVAMKDSGVAKKATPFDLAAMTLDGKPVRLADFRGRHLLLIFWAAWSERSLEALSAVPKLRAEFGNQVGLAYLGVNLDDDLDAAKNIVRANGYDWSQARLDSEARAKVTTAFDVNTLPAIFLLDAQGRVVGRDLEGERLRSAIQRAVAKK
jgi:hypothetical protein